MQKRRKKKRRSFLPLPPFFSFTFGVTPRKKQRNPLKKTKTKKKQKKGVGHRGQLSVRSASDKIIWVSRNPKTCARATITPNMITTPAHFSRLRCTAHSFAIGLQICRRSTRR